MNNISFFSDFSEEEKLSLSGLKDSILNFEQKTNLIKEGSTDNSVYILLQGKAIVSRQQTPHMTIATLIQGRFAVRSHSWAIAPGLKTLLQTAM